MTDDFGTRDERDITELAQGSLDADDEAILGSLAQVLDRADPVPEDLVERIQFSLALDEVFTEVAHISRMAADSLAVRSDPVAEVRTETMTFSAEHLTAMVTVTRQAGGRLRLDGWCAPEGRVRVHLRMPDGPDRVVVDDGGRFVFDELPEGFAQLTFHLGDTDVAVVTPLFQL